MGYDLIAISNVEPSALPVNATPFAECMYCAANETYYEHTRNGVTNYYKQTADSHTMTCEISLHTTDTILDTLRNHGIHLGDLFFNTSHTPTTLQVPHIQALHNINLDIFSPPVAQNVAELIAIIDFTCNNSGILLNI
jgi:hypothetical protein